MEIQTKDKLLEEISLAVEQIQKQFVQGGNVIKDSQETFFLCNCVDNILHHGLKEGLISWAMEPTVWPLLEKITCSKDIEEIKMLRLRNDKEKCSAWIKMAVNGNLLGSYIATIHQDESLLSSHYYEFAFLRDAVMADTVKSLLNYGIANFDFQIATEHNYPSKQIDTTAKQEWYTGYDASEQSSKTKMNGYESPKTEARLVTSQENWSKKKRKKKKQSVKNVVIEDPNDYGGFEETESTQNSPTVEHSLEETSGETIKEDRNLPGINENDNSLICNTDESLLVNDNQLGEGIVSDARTNSHDLSSKSHVYTPADDSKVNRTENQSDDLEEEGDRRVVVNTKLDQQLTVNNQQNSETTKKSNDEVDSLESIANSSSSRQEFSANDFLLEQTEPQSQNIVSDVDDVKTTNHLDEQSSLTPKPETDNASDMKNSDLTLSLQQSCKHPDSEKENSNSQKSVTDTSESSGNNQGLSSTDEKLTQELSNFITSDNSTNFPKSDETTQTNENPDEHHTNGELLETPKHKDYKSEKQGISSKGRAESNDEFSEIVTSGNSYDYRVRKVENPEFISSSYGSSSALSDFTDDDRDLNFIPGIHRMSSKSFSSSFEKKSAADSSMSFDENGFPVFESSHYTESSTSQPSSVDDSNGSRLADLSNEWDMFEDLLNVEEEHFSQPDSFAGLTTSEELEMAIDHYKKMIKMKKDKSQRDELVKKLVKLRLRLQQQKEGPPVENPKFRKILSHEFRKMEGSQGTKYFCDQCGKNIWTVWQSLFTCRGCGYHSHRKCLEHIQRHCPTKNLSSASYILDICPDTGLDAQQYRCAECRREIAFSKDDVAEARICDYTGQYFCDNCHWNDQISIPARVLRNWDFTQHKVCRKTKQLLELMRTRPIINIQEINPMLYRYVEELREVGKLREDILIMKKYFLTCREALESKLLIQLQKRQHFVDSADTYSIQDLMDLNNDVLLPEVSKIHALFLAHIKADCELCRARGFICEVCQDSTDIIFAFDPHAVKCTNCSAVFHKICFKPQDCPKCQRKKKAAEQT